ncbi:GNAT family N-acetyltransferase [Kribbella sandramycini]|uniref:GNAT family N-acetyltransferase n=1 Tax=Kribbella sandramycini TaxID=60450 RepID=A0A7Y4KV68_9ACTN|nr:GNAT family N-acetyltransferase [Kribbella sandramycini]MBB6568263.1 putative acetyltransferase [Kribbella sandramycini]NOL39144.1 GNAT family N-acetyltransferase [Kribbella sandramycini]
MPALIAPDAAFQNSWLESRAEWGSATQHGSGFHEDEHDAETTEGFAAWVGHLRQRSDDDTPLPPGSVPATYWWIVEGDEYLGAITLRHRLTDRLLEGGGHIGYGVRPSARGRGLAGWALGEILAHARGLGLGKVLVTCDDANPASARTIERNGGILEDVRETWLGRTRRYWITL